MSGDADEATLWEVLEVVREFVCRTKTLPPLLVDFFASFFEVWSGETGREVVFDILGFMPFHDYKG